MHVPRSRCVPGVPLTGNGMSQHVPLCRATHRQRHVDLMLNAAARRCLTVRSRLIRSVTHGLAPHSHR